MKITIYELLGLIKEGKAPKKIVIREESYNLMDDYNYSNINFAYINHRGDYWLDNAMLAEVVEIIEEEKEIEKLSFCDFAITINENASNNDRILMDKINELIDEVNKLKRDNE